MKHLNLRVAAYRLVLATTFLVGCFLASHLMGCSQLDKMSPDYAAHAALPASPTQPAQPAETRNVPAQVLDMLVKFAQNQTVQAVAAPIPYGTGALGVLGLLSAGLLTLVGRRAASNGTAAATSGILVKSLQVATGTDDPIAAIAASHAAIAAAPETPPAVSLPNPPVVSAVERPKV